MEWWGYLFWALVPILAQKTVRAKIGGTQVTIPIAQLPLFRSFNNIRIGILLFVVVATLPAALWGLLRWAWTYEWAYVFPWLR